jgi:hypothetical protein
MKQIVSNYSYSPATNVVTLTGVNIDADQLLLIVAPQVGRTLYNFASVTGTVSAGADTRVTLNASTAGLTTTSPLVIFYDDQGSTQTVAGTVTATNNAIDNYLISAFEDAATSDASVAIRVQGTPGYPMGISGTVTANGIQDQVQDALFGNDQLVNSLNAGLLLSENVPISGTVTVSNSVTIGSLPAISGTVTANAILQNANAMAQAFIDESNAYGSVSVVLSGSAGDIGVAGTVTAAAPNGSLTTRFGTPTTANVSFATSAVTNASRKYLLIQNVTTGSNVITVGIGFTPTTTQGIQLTAGAGITFESSYIPTGQIFVLSSVTASNFTILEA